MKLNRSKIDIVLAKKQMTISKLADVYGVSRNRIQVILNQKEVSPVCVGRMAKALECEVTEIIENE